MHQFILQEIEHSKEAALWLFNKTLLTNKLYEAFADTWLTTTQLKGQSGYSTWTNNQERPKLYLNRSRLCLKASFVKGGCLTEKKKVVLQLLLRSLHHTEKHGQSRKGQIKIKSLIEIRYMCFLRFEFAA